MNVIPIPSPGLGRIRVGGLASHACTMYYVVYLGVVYITDHDVVPFQRAFFHGHTFMVRFKKNAF